MGYEPAIFTLKNMQLNHLFKHYDIALNCFKNKFRIKNSRYNIADTSSVPHILDKIKYLPPKS